MLASMLYSKSEVFRIAAKTVIRLLRESRMTFLRADWPRITGLPQNRANDTCDLMLNRGVITNINPRTHLAEYKINVIPPAQGKARQKEPVSDQIIDPSVLNRTSVQEQRITQFIDEKKREGQTRFSTDEWQQRFGLSQSC